MMNIFCKAFDQNAELGVFGDNSLAYGLGLGEEFY